MAEGSLSKILLRLCLCLGLLVAGWRVLSLGLADHYAQADPMRALEWRPGHPAALAEAAEQLVALEPVRAGELAEAALAANPKEGRAYRVLGQLAESKGDQAKAIRNYEMATRNSPRDLLTHARLETYYLRAGRLAQAMQHIDLILRIQPQAYEGQYALLQAMAAVPQAHGALVNLLQQRPPWRSGFLLDLSRHAKSSVSIAPFMTRLRLAPGGLSDVELSAWLDRLRLDHRWGEAYLTWVGSLPPKEQAQLGNVFDGGFESEPSNAGFGWRFEPVPGAYIERLSTTGAGGKFALKVSFEDRRVPFRHVRQLLALPSGRYRLGGRARAERLRSERGLVWAVTCAEDDRSLAQTQPFTGQTEWRSFSSDFQVPPQNCGGQWLQLMIPFRIAAEQRIGGVAWFDDLRVVRNNERIVTGIP